MQHDGDAPGSAESTEQIALGGEGLGIGEPDSDLVPDQLFQVLDLVLVKGPDSQSAATRPGEDVVILERRFLFAAHIGLQPPHDDIDDLVFYQVGIGAGREIEEGIHRVPLHRREIVELRHHQPGCGDRDGHQGSYQGPASTRSAGERDEALGHPVPDARMIILELDVAKPPLSRRRQDRNRDKQGNGHGDGDGEGQVGEQLPRIILQEDYRQQT